MKTKKILVCYTYNLINTTISDPKSGLIQENELSDKKKENELIYNNMISQCLNSHF